MTDYKDYNHQLIEEFRADRSKFEGPGSRPLLLLTTTGAKSGKRHTTPMMYVPDGDRLLVIASNIGAPNHTDWYRNLVAHPVVELQDGAVKTERRARELAGAEKALWWKRVEAAFPPYAEYRERAGREIPIFVLEPVER